MALQVLLVRSQSNQTMKYTSSHRDRTKYCDFCKPLIRHDTYFDVCHMFYYTISHQIEHDINHFTIVTHVIAGYVTQDTWKCLWKGFTFYVWIRVVHSLLWTLIRFSFSCIITFRITYILYMKNWHTCTTLHFITIGQFKFAH